MELSNKNIFDGSIAIVGTVLSWLFGAWDVPLQILVCFMLLDYGSGLLKGYYLKTLSSNLGFKGIIKKASILVVLIVAVCLDKLTGSESLIFRAATCYFFIGNEGLSILENCGAMGLGVPNKILEALKQLRDGGNKND